VKKLLVAVIGGTVLLVGLVLLVLPGPGSVVIAAGLAILATEFIWARRVWRKAKGTVAKVRRKSGFRAWWQRFKARGNKAAETSKPQPSRELERQSPDRLRAKPDAPQADQEIGAPSRPEGHRANRSGHSLSEPPPNEIPTPPEQAQTDPTSGCDHGSR
jgi:hypothetical protein